MSQLNSGMRKYYQAALLAVATLSIITLLFYRHEYYKLRYVLEVFNYFGKPELKEHIDNCTEGNRRPEKVSSDFEDPFASWQRLNDDLFVYSSYGKSKSEVVTIGFGKLQNNLNFNCDVYLHEESRIAPGKFSYSIIKNTTDDIQNDEYCGYLLKCEHFEEGNPAGVAYYPSSDDNINKNSLILSLKQLPQPLSVDSYVFCVAPPENLMITFPEMTNFLNTHKSIGVDNFIVYDYGIAIASNKALKSSDKYDYTRIPWNFPFLKARSGIIKEIIELDCLYRTYNKVMYAAVLSWEEKIELHYHSSLHNLMFDFKKNKMYGQRFMFKSSVVCTPKKVGKHRVNSTISRKERNRPVYILKSDDVLHNEVFKTMEVLPELVDVKRYQECGSAQEIVKRKVSNYRKSFRFSGDT
ncbi:uncharacterized protein LOC117179680 [Belonocnema kinseyi]|uniref:uncharacterized protein LOC117179680 n=1 Tax=Belonocnema kinseyi TaxID=2817044 RepID=UPI00143DFA45|nr:uncharacterized protein LOC117179680 [Belonocnema kinseyi]